MRFHSKLISYSRLAARAATSLVLILFASALAIAEEDSTAVTADTSQAAEIILVEPPKVIDPDPQERRVVLSAALAILGGFGILLVLKKREADSKAGI